MTASHHELVGIPSDSVRTIETADGAVLLDIEQGLCLGMTPAAITIWKFISSGCSLDQITNHLADEFSDAPRQQIESDVVQFVADLEMNGLVRQSRASREGRALPLIVVKILQLRRITIHQQIRGPNTTGSCLLLWKALFGLVAIDLFRLSGKFARLCSFVRQWTVVPCSPPAATVEQVCRAINHASVWYPKRVFCLQRSAVTTCLLRSCGIAAEMVMGAQKFPFRAHAWTEVNGRPINERRDVQSTYLIWERC